MGHECGQYEAHYSRRDFLARTGLGLGAAALACLLNPAAALAGGDGRGRPHFLPRARRVIYLFQSGGPSQLELFDYKPELASRHGEELPASVRMGQRLTGMSGDQSSLPLAGSRFAFARHGESGAIGRAHV